MAPFVPFLAESIWQNLAGVFSGRSETSVHLCDYPLGDESHVDNTLSERMRLIREITSLGRNARMGSKLKVRQPLAKVEVVLADESHRDWIEMHGSLIREELNVKKVEFTRDADRFINYVVQPNFKRLGPRVGKLMPGLKKAIGEADGGKMLAELESNGKVVLDIGGEAVTLDNDDIEVRMQAKEGWAAAQGSQSVVVLSTDLTPELLREGLARDVIRMIQERRKELQCEYTDRIVIGIDTDSDELWAAIEENCELIKSETLAVSIARGPITRVEAKEATIGDATLSLYVGIDRA